MDPRLTLRNVSGKDHPSVLGCHEIWMVDFEDREIGKLSGSPVSNFYGTSDNSGQWLWHAVAYWGNDRPVPAWAKVPLGPPAFATKEAAASEILNYQVTCRDAGWKPGCWTKDRSSQSAGTE